QMTEGNMWLNETVGVIPKNAWAIDPFGYSPTMAYLLRRMGFENMLIQRTHYELKKELALNKNLEYVWRQSWDSDETTDIFVHMMPFYSYDVPHTCGPEPAVCCQFDFARMPGFVYERCPWGEHPVETDQENVKERALKLLDQYRKKSTLYRTNTLLVPLGDDFRYIGIDEAEAQFRNYQLLFDRINSDPALHAEAQFGTLDDYFRNLRAEADKRNYSRKGEIGSSEIGGFPSLSGDFFTYADRNQDYWSGYYVSRPFFKAVDRVLEETLRGAEMMMVFLLGYCHKIQCERLPSSFAYKLTSARRNLALFQHHDGVTGTAKDHVVVDYGMRMHLALTDLQIFMSKAIEVLLGIHRDKNDQNPANFEPAETRSKFDAQPVHRAIGAREGTVQTVVVFNPLEQTRDEVVMVVVERPDVTVLDSNWTCVRSQVSPELRRDRRREVFTGRHRLYWISSVPALGLQTYYIANGFAGCEKAKPARIRIRSDDSEHRVSCPHPYVCSDVESDTVDIRNDVMTLTFDASHGLLQKIGQRGGGIDVVGEEIAVYSSTGGAYLFKPNGDAESVTRSGGWSVISEGHLVQEFHAYLKTKWDESPVPHTTTRLYNVEGSIQASVVEKEYRVELLGREFDDKEVIARYRTGLDNGRVFYSDLNGFQTSRRETYDKIPLQGNYYPMPSLGFLQGSRGERFSVHTRQSLGAASLKDGWLEVMLDRRLTRDDGRGLGQAVTDNRPINVVFHLTMERNVSSSSSVDSSVSARNPSLFSHLVGARLNYPMHVFVAKSPESISAQPPPRSFSPLAAPSLPCDLHVVNLKVIRPQKLPGEAAGTAIVLWRRHWDSSYGQRGGAEECSTMADVDVNLFETFRGVSVSSVRPTSINLLHDDGDVGILGYSEEFAVGAREGHVVIAPMEIQAYKLQFMPQQ
ncbi:hypothetical protein M569_16612, partial [Genlisea aurea]